MKHTSTNKPKSYQSTNQDKSNLASKKAQSTQVTHKHKFIQLINNLIAKIRPAIQPLINFFSTHKSKIIYYIKKPMGIMLIGMFTLILLIFIYKGFMGYMIGKYMAASYNTPTAVSTTTVQYEQWQPTTKASGNIRAIFGINLAAEIAGIIRTINITKGAIVPENTVLVELNTDAEVARLHSLEALAALAAITNKRNLEQYKTNAVSKSTVDASAADLQSKEANVAEQKAIIAKKIIIAPFAGKLGISTISPGQYINPGDNLVSLQALDPIYVDFYLPQNMLSKVAKDYTVNVTNDAYPQQIFAGKITTIDPQINQITRNVKVEALIENKEFKLLPGMFAFVEVNTGNPEKYLTVPQAAVIFNSFGNIIYVVTDQSKNKKGKPTLIANQVFVETGDTRGDQIAVLSGLKEGDVIVTSGQLKLINGSRISINNTITPSNDPAPKPAIQ